MNKSELEILAEKLSVQWRAICREFMPGHTPIPLNRKLGFRRAVLAVVSACKCTNPNFKEGRFIGAIERDDEKLCLDGRHTLNALKNVDLPSPPLAKPPVVV